jgi:hypothetical protein
MRLIRLMKKMSPEKLSVNPFKENRYHDKSAKNPEGFGCLFIGMKQKCE